MAELSISRDVALRVALAAKCLDHIDVRSLIGFLDKAIGLPITPVKLAKITLKTLRKAGGEDLLRESPEDIKAALAHLKGQSDEVAGNLPNLENYEAGDMPDSLRVAIASNSGELLDGHFGSCTRFLIYQVSQDEARLVDIRFVESIDEEEEKNVSRANLIQDCQILYVVSVGGPAVPKIIRKGIHPIKKPDGGNARDVLESLQRVLKGSVPPWLAKILGHTAEQRVRFEREEVEA